jgi:hypothetical protein
MHLVFHGINSFDSLSCFVMVVANVQTRAIHTAGGGSEFGTTRSRILICYCRHQYVYGFAFKVSDFTSCSLYHGCLINPNLSPVTFGYNIVITCVVTVYLCHVRLFYHQSAFPVDAALLGGWMYDWPKHNVCGRILDSGHCNFSLYFRA